MALNMEALLRLRTTVEGMQAVSGLNSKLGVLQNTAKNAGEGMRQMGRGAGELLSPIRALVPAVGAVGMIGMAKGAIDNADALSKMSARTGATVENLSKFQQAANLSDTSIEGVGKGLTALSRSMAAAQDGTGKQAETFRKLGIEIVDANGKLRSTDEVMLDIAEAFSGMEDGAEKSADAMTLLGKGGVELIPMLNEGREGIEKFTATISTEFGDKAAQFNDKMTEIGQRFGELGIKLAEGLLPHLDSLADAILGIINVFMGLPGEVQAALIVFTVFGPQVITLAKILGGLIAVVKGVGVAFTGLKLGAIIAGWLPAILPALAGIIAAFKGLVVGVLAVITGPVGLTVLAIAGIVAMAIAFRKPIIEFAKWFAGQFKPLLNVLTSFADFSRSILQTAFAAIMKLLYLIFVQPFVNIWDKLLRAPVMAFAEFVPNVMKRIGESITSVFVGALDMVRNVFRSILRFIVDGINTVTRLVNRLIEGFNRLPGANIPFIPTLQVPEFAQGGVVKKPTLGVIGEGGETEYVIPESKMAAASSRFLGGARGDAVLAGGAQPSASREQPPTVNLQVRTGPVMEFDGKRYVLMEDFERGIRQVADGVVSSMRKPSARLALGRG